nr:transmembrane protein 170B isoform X1 [Oryctolagus cuniculus]
MKAEGGDHSMINLSVQQVLSLWAHGTVLRNLTEMWYWIFLWALFSSLFVHGAAGVLMFVMLQRHRQGRVISVIAVSLGFLASVTGAMITRMTEEEIFHRSIRGSYLGPHVSVSLFSRPWNGALARCQCGEHSETLLES